LRRALTALLCVLASAPLSRAADRSGKPPRGYVELQGAEAKQFLIGNTLGAVRANAQFENGRIYFAEGGTILDRGDQFCEIKPHKLTDAENCSLIVPISPNCERYRVFRKVGVDTLRVSDGAPLGNYVGEGRYSSSHRRVLKGNATGCPVVMSNWIAKPVEISAQQAELVDQGAPGRYDLFKSPEAFPEDVRIRYLVGNSVVRRNEYPGCGDTVTYFSPDGRAIQYHCYATAPARSGEPAPPTATIETLLRWRVTNANMCFSVDSERTSCTLKPVAKRFCLEYPDDKGKFGDCLSFDLETVAVGTDAEKRFQIRVKDSLEGFPGLLVSGDPMGLAHFAPPPKK